MKKRLNLILCGVLALALLLLSGCARQGEPQAVEKSTSLGIDETSPQSKTAPHQDDDDASVVSMYLTVRRGNAAEDTDHTWEEINSYSSFYYIERGIDRYGVEAILQVGDEHGPIAGELGYGLQIANAIVQIRGGNSSMSRQKSYKISLKNNAGSWRDQTTITLNKHSGDGLRFRNKLGYDLMREIPGMIALRTQFVRLYVKDETKENPDTLFYDYGLFTQVEQPNKTFLYNYGLDRNGNLYKANDFTFARYAEALKLETDITYDRAAFEAVLESKGDSNHTKLLAMLDVLADETVPVQEAFERYFDAENYFTWLAFQILTDNIGAAVSNFYLYSPVNGQKWYFISWDLDAIWSGREDVLRQNTGVQPERSLGFEYGIANLWPSLLHRRVLGEASYRAMLDEKIEAVRGYLSKEAIDDLVALYREPVKALTYSMPDAMHARLTAALYDQVADTIADEVEEAYALYQLSLQKPSPFRVETPVREGYGLTLRWEDAVSFSGEEIVYTVEVARDFLFEDIVFVQHGIRETELQVSEDSRGQYFVRVTASDESGNFRYAMDRYDDVYGTAHYGVKCFYILSDTEVVADDYYPVRDRPMR